MRRALNKGFEQKGVWGGFQCPSLLFRGCGVFQKGERPGDGASLNLANFHVRTFFGYEYCFFLRQLFLMVENYCANRPIPGEYRVHSMKNRRAVGLLNIMRNKNRRQEPRGKTDDTCDHGMSRSWKAEVCKKKYIYIHKYIYISIYDGVTQAVDNL